VEHYFLEMALLLFSSVSWCCSDFHASSTLISLNCEKVTTSRTAGGWLIITDNYSESAVNFIKADRTFLAYNLKLQYFTILCEIAERASSDAACPVYPASEDAYSALKL
jgi:hypothetical protein